MRNDEDQQVACYIQLAIAIQIYFLWLHAAVKNKWKSVLQILRDKTMESNNNKERKRKSKKSEVENIVDIIILPSMGKGKHRIH